MKLLEKPTPVSKSLLLKFSVDNSQWYLITISARVKDEKQLNSTDDEDLQIEIDGKKFPLLTNKQRYKDSPAAFSGGKSHDKLQTNFYILKLDSTEHAITLISDREALVETVNIEPITTFPRLSLELDQQAEQANDRSWLNFVLIDLPLTSFSVKGKIEWRFPDGDDIKIIVDGKIKKNLFSIRHKNWIFTSNVLSKLFGKETVEEVFTENLPKEKLHYIEIWADERPTAYFIEFNFATAVEEIKPYRSGPNGEDYNQYDRDIKDAVNYWNNFFKQQNLPPPEPLDPNLVKAMIHVESRMGYGSSGGYPAKPDIMQIADPANPAIHTLNNDGWVDPGTGNVAREYEWQNGKLEILDFGGLANARDENQSVYWGVCWLYHKAQVIEKNGGRTWKSWKEAVSDYNGGGDPNYVEKVYKICWQALSPEGF